MTVRSTGGAPAWLAWLDLGCAGLAGATWYVRPQMGAWPLALALLPWMLRLTATGRLGVRTRFDLPLGFFLLTAGLGLWAAYDRSAAWNKFWLVVGALLLFYALSNAASLGDRRAWLPALFGAGLALYFLATNDWSANPAKFEALTRLGRALQAPLPALPGHRLHPNVAGGMLAVVLPFGAWLACRRGGGPAARFVALAAVLLMAFALLMTTSRGAWLALAGALALAALWVLCGRLAHGAVSRRRALFGLAVAGLLAALALSIVASGGVLPLLDVIPGPRNAAGRLELLHRTLPLVADYAFVGSGPGGFQMLYSTYALLIHAPFTVHSHNLFFDVAVEQGLPALASLVVAWLFMARAAWRTLPCPGAGLVSAAVLSLVVMLVHALVDDVFYGSRALLLLFLPLAFVPAFPASRADSWAGSRPGRAVALPLLAIALLGAILAWRAPILSRIHSNLAAVEQSREELRLFAWPEWPLQDAVRREIDLSGPVARYRHALALDAGNESANRRLGQIELSLGQYEAALDHLRAAYEARPGNATVRQLYGEALIANGHVAEGRALWATVPNEQGQLHIRAYWYRYIGDEGRAAWMTEAAQP